MISQLLASINSTKIAVFDPWGNRISQVGFVQQQSRRAHAAIRNLLPGDLIVRSPSPLLRHSAILSGALT
jgi:hypothetical protein